MCIKRLCHKANPQGKRARLQRLLSSLILYLCLILPLLYPLHIFFICNSLPCCHLLLLTCTCSLGLHNIPIGVKCFSTDAFSCRCFPYSTSIFPYSISSLFFSLLPSSLLHSFVLFMPIISLKWDMSWLL